MATPLKDPSEKDNFRAEVVNLEKKLRTLILWKGLLHSDVKDSYRKICTGYEKTILTKCEQVAELQDVEYSLWKLHYKLIDEFRKRIKRTSLDSENVRFNNMQRSHDEDDDSNVVGFKLFLSEATEFYRNLIVKLWKYHGISEDYSDRIKEQKCQFFCHRFLVCLGDLARYKELYEKSNACFHDWSFAANHYLEATTIWPDSGNPQNQLAVLATYVGDEFLALYHCVRSFSVKEPFPDAWGNLILLFERNRSSHFPSISRKLQFDFSNPSEKSFFDWKSQTGDGLSNGTMSDAEDVNSLERNLWPLIIRMFGFFFIKSSLEDFPCTFASTMRCLDSLMALDDSNLKASLESYRRINSVRTGPFRAIQVVSLLVFTLQNQFNKLETQEVKDTAGQHLTFTQMGLTSTFIFIGRLVERCSNGSELDSCPVLSAVLVFMEWLARTMDQVEKYGFDGKSRSAMSYFFDALVKLLGNLNFDKSEVKSLQGIPLWEDYELRGFTPVSAIHEFLDFSMFPERLDRSECAPEFKCRIVRIVDAAIKISNRSEDSHKWIFYDKSRRKFYRSELKEIEKKRELEEVKSCSDLNEEEVILFKPLIRYNSAPLHEDQKPSQSSITNIGGNKPFDGPCSFPEIPCAGPPSLNAWVLNKGSSSNSSSSFTEQNLSHIMKIAPTTSLDSLTLSENGDSIPHHPSPSYSAPLPSAPLLPEEDNVCFFNEQSDSSQNGFSNCTTMQGPLDHYGPTRLLTSSEWLRQHRENHNPNRIPFHAYDGSRYDFIDPRREYPLFPNPVIYTESPALYSPVLPLVYAADENRTDPHFFEYQMQSSYGFGALTDVRNEQLPLLQYLKEKERKIQRDFAFNGPAYMGN